VINELFGAVSLIQTTIIFDNMPQTLDHSANVYLTVALSPGLSLSSGPSDLAVVHPSLNHRGLAVDTIPDIQLYSVPKPQWEDIHADVLKSIREREGVVRVDVVQPPRQRSKRDEL
jgi:hypothetical protein